MVFQLSFRKWMGVLTLCLLCLPLAAHPDTDERKKLEEQLNLFFGTYQPKAEIPRVSLKKLEINPEEKTVTVCPSEAFAYQPFRPDMVEEIYRNIQEMMPRKWRRYRVNVVADGKEISELIPNYYRSRRKTDRERLNITRSRNEAPWTRNVSKPVEAEKGLYGRHIAVWQSHGLYFKNEKHEWIWQRPRLFCTTEDLFTKSFVVPYLIPMLENAGACVFTPRERDQQTQEVIVDNDVRNGSLYVEKNSRKSEWRTTDFPGFGSDGETCSEGENPFVTGTARWIPTEKKEGRAFVEWVPDIPQSGSYAVYVSYQSLPQSVTDARYLVFHKGGITEFEVNQRMGGNTWVYLGTFDFEAGVNQQGMVLLSNQSRQKGVVCADGVRFGGGMGNISRQGSVSGMPRYLEGARYMAQWSGMPCEVYNGRKGQNDYADDINSRSLTVNYLAGGSASNPEAEGKRVPFDLTVGIHSDAGYKADNGIVGTLGIYTTDFNGGRLAAGNSRYASRDLTDLLLSQIQNDISRAFQISWPRRAMWNRNYSETRLPAVPSAIVEMLSHQNFADMRWGHDPNFKFVMGRALYKGILRFVATQNQCDYVVQPLPVSHFAAELDRKRSKVTLSWRPVSDPEEPTAEPDYYLLYTRTGDGSFDNGMKVKGESVKVDIEPGVVYSFKITAVNKGGESFPSEILSAYKAPRERGRILIVNGFDRLSGPSNIDSDRESGFLLQEDPGIPYLWSSAFCGPQQCYDRKHGGKEGKGSLGHSDDSWEGIRIAGNTFDYPFIHGKAIQATGGFSFSSCSDEALEDETLIPDSYQIIDYILGMEKENAADTRYYKTFSSAMQRILTVFCQIGGSVMVSGAYVGSDMSSSQGNREFTRDILKYSWKESLSDKGANTVSGLRQRFSLPRIPNSRMYVPAQVDCLSAVGGSFPVLSYLPGNQTAATAYNGQDYKTFVLGFPFECIETADERARLMSAILHFLEQ